MEHGLLKKIGYGVLLVALFAGLSSCGRRGALQAPSAGVATEEGVEAPVEQEKPDRKFILDGLI